MLDLGHRHSFIGTVRCDACRITYAVERTSLSLALYALTTGGWQADVRRQVCPRCVAVKQAA